MDGLGFGIGFDRRYVACIVQVSMRGTVHISCMVQGSSVVVFGSRFLVRTALA